MTDASARLFLLAEAELGPSRTSHSSLKALLMVIAAHEGMALSVMGLAARAGLSRASTIRGIAELEALGVIEPAQLARRARGWLIDWSLLARSFTETDVTDGVDRVAGAARLENALRRRSVIASSRRKGAVDGAKGERDSQFDAREVGHQPAGGSD